MLNRLREYLRTATRDELDAKYKELYGFLSIGPIVTEYLDTLYPTTFEPSNYNSTVDPEFSLDFFFIKHTYNDTRSFYSQKVHF